MSFEKHCVRPRSAFPVGTPPVISVIDHLARPVHVLGLEIRGGIGNFDVVVDSEPVACAGSCLRDFEHEPIAIFSHRHPAFEDEIDLPCSGRPQAERDAAIGEQRAEPWRVAIFIWHDPSLRSSPRTRGSSEASESVWFWVPAFAGTKGCAVPSSLHACKSQYGSRLRSPMATELEDCGIGLSVRRVTRHCQRAIAGHWGPLMSTVSSAPLSTIN